MLPILEMAPVATALIADSSAPVRRAARFLLESLGFEVAGARSGEEAMAMVEGMAPDLILLDARLAGPDAASLIEAIRALPEGRRTCLFFIADGGSSGIRAAIEAGADDYLVKPFDRELLSFKLAQARARGRLTEGTSAIRLVQDNSNSWRFRVFGKAI